jgi:hypothetical protein
MLMQVKVVRPALIGGEPRKVGDVVELPQAQALDAASGWRMEVVRASVEPAAEEPVVEVAAAKKRGKAEE